MGRKKKQKEIDQDIDEEAEVKESSDILHHDVKRSIAAVFSIFTLGILFCAWVFKSAGMLGTFLTEWRDSAWAGKVDISFWLFPPVFFSSSSDEFVVGCGEA